MELYDTLTRTVKPLAMRTPDHLSVYCCGPTVYDLPHLGHGRQMLVYDVLRRHLTAAGIKVAFVSNITDVDDKIINRAANEGVAFSTVALTYEEAWYKAMDALGVLRPDADPHATAHIEGMVAAIQEMVRTDHAYVTSRGVWFDVTSIPDHGALSHQDAAERLAGARVEVDPEKRNPADFALWKLTAEPAWDSPWGRGRPGWHTECVVMALSLLGEGFDLHTGGMDLAFPHHENERSQALALGKEFAQHWTHHAFVETKGRRMGKSEGNALGLTAVLSEYDPRALRLLVLRSHYRSPLEITPKALGDASAALERLQSLARRLGSEVRGTEPSPDVVEKVVQALDSDLDTPRAVALLFQEARMLNSALEGGTLDAARASAFLVSWERMGLFLTDEEEAPQEVTDLLAKRNMARSEKSWAEADRLRSLITESGWAIEDTPSGSRLVRI